MSESATKRQFHQALRAAGWSVLVIWLFFVYHRVFFVDVRTWGIFPRAMWSLPDIFTAPLTHGDIYHIISNTFPLFVSMGIIFYFYRRVAWQAFVSIYLLTGLAMWAFADLLFDDTRAYHIGASGVVYGLVAFIFWTGILRRNFRSIILALVVLFLFQGMFAGISPSLEAERISWEGHLYGALTGVFMAYVLRRKIEPGEKRKYSDEEEEEESEARYFLERDAFEKTKEERRREQEGEGWFTDRTW